MTVVFYIFLALLIGLPIGWLASEFSKYRALRIVLGILALCTVAFCTWTTNALLTHIQYNQMYGFATRDLIDASLEQIDKGHTDRVQKAWRGIKGKYLPDYESRANYDVLVTEAVEAMRQDEERKPDEGR